MTSLNSIFSRVSVNIYRPQSMSLSVILFWGCACLVPSGVGGMSMSTGWMAMSRGQVCLGMGGYTRGSRYTRGSGYTRGGRYTRKVSILGGLVYMVYIPPDMGAGIPTPNRYWHLVAATTTHTVGKQVVQCLLECFLVLF